MGNTVRRLRIGRALLHLPTFPALARVNAVLLRPWAPRVQPDCAPFGELVGHSVYRVGFCLAQQHTQGLTIAMHHAFEERALDCSR